MFEFSQGQRGGSSTFQSLKIRRLHFENVHSHPKKKRGILETVSATGGGCILQQKKSEENDWLELLLGAMTCSLDTKAVQDLCQDLQLSKPMCPGYPDGVEWTRLRDVEAPDFLVPKFMRYLYKYFLFFFSGRKYVTPF